MNKLALFLILCLAVIPFKAPAQGYDRSFRGNPWNDGKGPTGLRLVETGGAFAEGYGSFIQGNLRSSSEAASAWTAGVRTASLRHFDRVSLTGALDLSQTWGQGMAGSLMARPGAYPIDFYEFSPAPKARQAADLSGGLCHDLSSSWRWGVKGGLGFSRNLKRETLSHSASYLSASIQPGIQYHRDRFAMALNYLFQYNADRIRLDQENSGAEPPVVFYDQGLYYGREDPWYQSPILSDGPLFSESFQGLSLQMSEGAFYAGILARLRDGKTSGTQQIANRFSGWDLDADTDWRRGPHRIHVSVDYFQQALREGAVSDTQASDRSTLKGGLQYGFSGKGWGFSVLASMLDREGSVLTGDRRQYTVRQQVLIPSLDTQWILSLGSAGLRLSAGWTCGSLTEKGLPDGVSPLRLERYFVKYREHMTSQKITLSPGVRYRFGDGWYADAALWWNHGFRMQYLGSDRYSATLRFGFEF